MILAQVRAAAVSSLAAGLGIDAGQASCEFGHLASHALDHDGSQPLDDSRVRLTQAQHERIKTLVAARLDGRPLAHVLQSQPFYGLDLRCTPAALAPRAETELLVEAVIASAAPDAAIADLGCGGGAIAAALARNLPNARITAIEASADAFTLAQDNLRRLGLDAKIQLLHGDWAKAPADLQVIVSNPPYVATGTCNAMRRDSRLHDPVEALDGGADGLDCLRQIAAIAAASLVPGGQLFFEHGLGQHHAACAICERAGLQVAGFKRDLQGIKRIVHARR